MIHATDSIFSRTKFKSKYYNYECSLFGLFGVRKYYGVWDENISSVKITEQNIAQLTRQLNARALRNFLGSLLFIPFLGFSSDGLSRFGSRIRNEMKNREKPERREEKEFTSKILCFRCFDIEYSMLFVSKKRRICDMHPMFNQISISSATILCNWSWLAAFCQSGTLCAMCRNWAVLCASVRSFLIWFAPPLHIFQSFFPIYSFSFPSFGFSFFSFVLLHKLNDWQYKLY